MSYLYVSVYNTIAFAGGRSGIPAPQEPAIADWVLEIGAKSVQSPKFPDNAHFVSIVTEDSCALAFGADPLADPKLKLVFPGERLFFGVHPGHKLAVVDV